MSAPRPLAIAGIGAWTRGAPDWATLRAVLRGERGLALDAADRPAAAVLPIAERRRAPDGVRLAAEVAAQACAMAGCNAATLPCVFASTHGELAITDRICATLAHTPLDVSPTRFHNSVLNAPAGYWTIATGCTAASSAVTAYHRSFAAGLLEALALAAADATPVLFGCGDVASFGPLAEMTRTTLAFGVALVLTPAPRAGARWHWSLGSNAARMRAVPTALRTIADDNPANAHALGLLAALAESAPGRLSLPLSPALSLDLEPAP